MPNEQVAENRHKGTQVGLKEEYICCGDSFAAGKW